MLCQLPPARGADSADALCEYAMSFPMRHAATLLRALAPCQSFIFFHADAAAPLAGHAMLLLSITQRCCRASDDARYDIRCFCAPLASRQRHDAVAP